MECRHTWKKKLGDPGVFFLIEQLPARGALHLWLVAADNAIHLVRPMFVDQWPAHPLRYGLVLVATPALAFWLALAQTRRRFAG